MRGRGHLNIYRCIIDAQSTSDGELAAKTAEWQQAMEIGQDLLEKNRALQDELDHTQHNAEQLKAQLVWISQPLTTSSLNQKNSN